MQLEMYYQSIELQGMCQEFVSAGAGASWRALGLKTVGAHSTRTWVLYAAET